MKKCIATVLVSLMILITGCDERGSGLRETAEVETMNNNFQTLYEEYADFKQPNFDTKIYEDEYLSVEIPALWYLSDKNPPGIDESIYKIIFTSDKIKDDTRVDSYFLRMELLDEKIIRDMDMDIEDNDEIVNKAENLKELINYYMDNFGYRLDKKDVKAYYVNRSGVGTVMVHEVKLFGQKKYIGVFVYNENKSKMLAVSVYTTASKLENEIDSSEVLLHFLNTIKFKDVEGE